MADLLNPLPVRVPYLSDWEAFLSQYRDIPNGDDEDTEWETDPDQWNLYRWYKYMIDMASVMRGVSISVGEDGIPYYVESGWWEGITDLEKYKKFHPDVEIWILQEAL